MGLSPYERTLAIAEKSGVKFFQQRLTENIPAIALRKGGKMGVFIDESAFETEVERRYAVVHEMAHCEVGSFYNESTPETECRKIDNRTQTHTIMRLVPFEMYEDAIINGCLDEHEQAEKWDIPQKYVYLVHHVYENTRSSDVQRLRKMALSDYA